MRKEFKPGPATGGEKSFSTSKGGARMKGYTRAILAIMGICMILFPGCRRVIVESQPDVVYEKEPGPPPHAPAHGYRRKYYSYIFYPSCSIYLDIERKLYFFLDAGAWKTAAILPPHIHLAMEGSVNIEMDTQTPYIKIDEHRKQYPPGQIRKEQPVKGHPGAVKVKGKKGR
jgi:hypothetical protein